MNNMEVKINGKVLSIVIPDVTIREEREGKKTSRVATSNGWYAIDGTGIAVNLNVSYNPKYDTSIKETPSMTIEQFAKLSKAEQAKLIASLK